MRIAVRVAADFHFYFTAKRRFLDSISVITSKSVPLFLHSTALRLHSLCRTVQIIDLLSTHSTPQ